MNEYRIDKSTNSIYEYSEDQDAYLYAYSFLQIGAKSNMRDTTILKLISEYKLTH